MFHRNTQDQSSNVKAGSRVVFEADVLVWLRERERLDGCSVVASMPDFSEFPHLSLDEWKTWFTDTAKLILSRTPDDGITLFFQSDIKRAGVWIDKGYLVAKAAEATGDALLFHKILCRAPPGQTTFGKPAYSHLLAFSRGVRPPVDQSTADVIPDIGEKTWPRGMGFHACRIVAESVLRLTDTRTLVSLFCGQGSVLAVANSLGLSAIGVERSPKRAGLARTLSLTRDGLGFDLEADL
jgi:hypothetical protein